MLSKKDLISINLLFHNGKIVQGSSLDFALDQAKNTKDWLKATAYLTRAIILDHPFEDGNKRTAATIITTYIELQNLNFEPKQVDEIVVRIAKKNMKDLRKIMRLIKNVLQ